MLATKDPDTLSPPASFVMRLSRGLSHRVARTRKQALRRLKVVDAITGGIRRRRKDLYFRARESGYGRAMLRAVSFAGAPLDLQRRRRAAARYLAGARRAEIDPIRGYGPVSFSPGELAGVLATSRRLFEAKKAAFDAAFAAFTPEKQAKFLARKGSFYRHLLTDDDLRRHPDLVAFALGDATLGAATRYLGMVPYLSRVDLVYSLPRPGDNVDSQLFHLDPEGLRQVKFFIHVFDVTDAEGPFSFIPADTSARVLSDVAARRRRGGAPLSRRYSDEEVAAAAGLDSVVCVKGPAGSGVAVDTSRCLHLGSRVSPGTFRLVLYLQYCTTREQTNVFDAHRFEGDEAAFLAVSHSLERGRARIDTVETMG